MSGISTVRLASESKPLVLSIKKSRYLKESRGKSSNTIVEAYKPFVRFSVLVKYIPYAYATPVTANKIVNIVNSKHA